MKSRIHKKHGFLQVLMEVRSLQPAPFAPLFFFPALAGNIYFHLVFSHVPQKTGFVQIKCKKTEKQASEGLTHLFFCGYHNLYQGSTARVETGKQGKTNVLSPPFVWCCLALRIRLLNSHSQQTNELHDLVFLTLISVTYFCQGPLSHTCFTLHTGTK